MQLKGAEARLNRALAQSIKRLAEQLAATDAHLQAVSPQRVLERGYTVTLSKKTGQVIRSAGALKAHERVVTRFADGEVESVVADPGQAELFD